jgi:menaquinone-9 beta-reductase
MRERRFDVVITGGGIAGSAAGILLARAGARVALVERTDEFRDRVRGEWLSPWGVREARRLGLLPVLTRAGAHSVPWNISRSGKPRLIATPEGDVPVTFSHPRLQEELLAEAWDAGVTVIRPAIVQDVTPRAGGKPASVTLERGGRHERLNALMVVGADGRSSLARRALGHPEHEHRSPRMLAGVLLEDVRMPEDRSYFLIRGQGAGMAMLYPQGGGRARAYVIVPAADQSSLRGDGALGQFLHLAEAAGIPGDVLAATRQAGPLAAFVAGDAWVEHPYRDGLALVGDAAGTSDPTWGMGIALALRDARQLVEAWIAEGAAEQAGQRYAAEHDHYFDVIRRVEDWQSDLLFATDPGAESRRRHAARLWSEDPSRFPDLNGLGPDVDASEAARLRFLGLDAAQEDNDAIASPVAVA